MICLVNASSLHRFHVRCSSVFLGVLVACWTLCYAYMYAVKSEADNANALGYLFAVLNFAQGVCLLTCHCLHNDKIRYEYSKFVLQQSWLPRCLRCSQQQQQQHLAGGNNSGGTAAGADNSAKDPGAAASPHLVGTQSATNPRHHLHMHQQQRMMDGSLGGDGGDSATLQPPHLHQPQHHHHHQHTTGTAKGKLFKHHPTMGGTLGLQSNVVVVERDGSVRQVDQTSPTSSAGSTHLIYNTSGNQALDNQPDWSYTPTTAVASVGGGGSQPFLHHPAASHHYHHQMSLKHPSSAADYRKNSMSSLSSTSSPSPRQLQRQVSAVQAANSSLAGPKEYFYWTEKRPTGRRNATPRKVAAIGMDSSGAIVAGQQQQQPHIIRSDTMNAIFPSYRKNPAHYSAASHHDPEDDDDEDDHPGSYLARYDQQRQQFGMTGGSDLYDDERFQHHHMHHKQQSQRGSPPPLGGIEHLQMLLQNQHTNIPLGRGAPRDQPGGAGYYSQYQVAPGYAIEEPVYEEIMSNRGSRLGADDAISPAGEDNHLRQSTSNR